MRRRDCCGALLAAGLFTALPARAALRNPCLDPQAVARDEIVLRALEGLDPSRLWDCHAHLLGNGDSGSGCSVHASMHQWWHPVEVLRRHAILNAACVAGAFVDIGYVDRLRALADAFPAGARWLLYAFDLAHDDDGRPRSDWTTFHVPDAYAASIARQQPDRFEWVASIHPCRPDAIERMRAALAAGARALKWLPSAMNIDLRDARCAPVYAELARHDVPLIVHCGEERAVPGAGRDELGNPLLLRHPLAAGVRVIAAHAASLGSAADLDRRSAPETSAFALWARLMDEPAWHGRLLADISALFQANRPPDIWRRVLRTEAWHDRLLHGSDYPLPGVQPLFSPARLADAGLLAPADIAPLERLRRHNALLFDLALKRAA